MAAPYGAWSRESGGTGESLYHSQRAGWNQTPPIDKTTQLPYRMRDALVRNRQGPNKTWAWQISVWADLNHVSSNFPRIVTDTVNLSYERLINNVRSNADASLGETLGELGQSYAMVGDRLKQLATVVRGVKQRNLAIVRGALGDVRVREDRWRRSRKASDLFLEVHLGWEPLIKDIYNAIQVLQSPLPVFHPVKASASSPYIGDTETSVNTENPNAWYPSSTRQISYGRVKGNLTVRQGCYVSVANPNLYTATQLGLTNPASVAWALVPFSFVVDWFVNVSQVLNSFTDFLGLTVSGGHTSYQFSFSHEKYLLSTYRWEEDGAIVHGGGVFQDTVANGFGYERKTGLTLPVLQLRPWKVPGLARAATAASLLVQLLPRK